MTVFISRRELLTKTGTGLGMLGLVGLLGDPVKDKTVYEASSPLTYLTHVKAPLLVLAGGNDIRMGGEVAAGR